MPGEYSDALLLEWTSEGTVRISVLAETCDHCGQRVKYWNSDGGLDGDGYASCGCTIEGPEACDTVIMRPQANALIAAAMIKLGMRS